MEILLLIYSKSYIMSLSCPDNITQAMYEPTAGKV